MGSPLHSLSFTTAGGQLGPGQTFGSHASLDVAMQNSPIAGPWVLSVRDFAPVQLAPVSSHMRSSRGGGSLGIWSAHFYTGTGTPVTLFPDVAVRISTLPKYGMLHAANMSLFDLPTSSTVHPGIVGPQVKPQPGTEPMFLPCTAALCIAGGPGGRTTTVDHGGIPPPNHRLTVQDNALAVVYTPYSPLWEGDDRFTYTTVVNGVHSAPATVTVHVRRCGGPICIAAKPSGLPPSQAAVWDAIHAGGESTAGERRQWTVQE